MKSFKQLIDEAKFEVELSKDDGWATVINKDDVYDLVEEWLKAKLEESITEQIQYGFDPITPTANLYHLLEELKQ